MNVCNKIAGRRENHSGRRPGNMAPLCGCKQEAATRLQKGPPLKGNKKAVAMRLHTRRTRGATIKSLLRDCSLVMRQYYDIEYRNPHS